MNSEVTVGAVSALLGFLGGLLLPWVRWEVEKRRLERREKADLVSLCKLSIEQFDFQNENFGESVWYSSLRAHMNPDVVAKLEAPRTFYVGGVRGDNVEKQFLLDEVARLEKELWQR